MEKRQWIYLAVVIAALAVLMPAACAAPRVGDPAPNFSLPTLDGGQFQLWSNFGAGGKVVLLDFWATWCPPCRAEIPYLVQFYNRYKDRGLVVCGVAVSDDESSVRSYVNQNGVNYTVCLDTYPSTVQGPYGITGIPDTLIMDRQGIIRYAQVGFSTGHVPEMERVIQELLDQGAVSVTGITPNQAPNNAIVNITEISGADFKAGATVKLTKTGQSDITATDVNVTSETRITCKFDLTGKAAGKWNVVVRNSDGSSGSLNEGFTVIAAAQPPPTVTGIAPNSGTDNSIVNITELAGTGFANGATIKLTRQGQPDVAATSVIFINSTKMTCTFDLIGKAAGKWNVVVTNPDSQSGTLQEGFTVVATPAPAPTVSGITPNSGYNTALITISNLAGTGFRVGATVRLRKSGEQDIVATGVSVVNSTRITCTLNLAGKEVGQWDVLVTNSDGQSGELRSGFTITRPPSPAPTVTGITPNYGYDKGITSITNLVGTGFQAGAVVTFTKTGQPVITATEVAVVSATKITCQVNMAGQAQGLWNVLVTNPDGQVGAMVNAFTVSSAPNTAPTVTGITPSFGINNGPVSITDLAGTGFRDGATVKLTRPGQGDIQAGSVAVVSSAKITCVFDLSGKQAGAYNVVVTNTDGQSGALADGFTVSNPAAPAPVVTSIAPRSGSNEGTVDIAELAGANFQSGAAVKLTRSGEADIVATNVEVVSTSKIKCKFDLTGKTMGWWNVVVVNADSQPGSLPEGFRITGPPAPAPTLTSVTPNSRPNTGVLEVTDLAGTGFQPEATVKLTRSGEAAIVATNVNVVSPTRITCRFDVFEAAVGKWNVVLTNPDEQSATLAEAVTILAAPVLPPTVARIEPRSATNTGPVNAAGIFGANFRPGAAVRLTRAGRPDIVATEVAVANPEKITCRFDLTGKAVGKWNVVVTNPDGQTSSLAEGFAVCEVLRVTGITPGSGTCTGAVSITDLAGAGFQPGASVRLARAGQADVLGVDVNVANPSKITCVFDLTGRPVGRWNVVVTNPDGQTAVLTEAFQVCDSPSVSITSPVTTASCCRNYPLVDLAGTASDADGVARVTWSNSRGGSGDCAGTTSWRVEGVSLLEGENVLTVTAIDTFGRTSTDTLAVTYTNAQPGSAWQGLAMVSVPIIPDQTDPKPVVGFAGVAWSMFRTSSGTYVTYGNDPEHFTWFEPPTNAPGRGFWARFEGSPSMVVGTIPPQDREVAIRLYPGWNLVGQPFITPVTWDFNKIQVEVGGVRQPLGARADAVCQFAWGWNAASGSYYLVCDPTVLPGSVGSMAPWQAYWIRAKRECTLILKAM